MRINYIDSTPDEYEPRHFRALIPEKCAPPPPQHNAPPREGQPVQLNPPAHPGMFERSDARVVSAAPPPHRRDTVAMADDDPYTLPCGRIETGPVAPAEPRPVRWPLSKTNTVQRAGAAAALSHGQTGPG